MGSLKDGDASVQVSVTNVNGNGASAGREYSVDATAPTVSIEIVSDNNIINAAEAQQDLVVNGVTNAEAGQTVTVTLNGVDYTTTVQANGSWSVTVPSADLSGITDGNYTISAAVSDKAGNPASADRDVLVDTTVPQLTIHTVSDDDVINSAEHAQALIVTGSVTGAAAAMWSPSPSTANRTPPPWMPQATGAWACLRRTLPPWPPEITPLPRR